MQRTKALSNSQFLQRVGEYLPTHASIFDLDCDGKPHPDGPVQLSPNTFYQFDAEALQAMCYAIEEIALEEAKGRFVAAVQDFSQFDALKERYWQLAATLDDVQVIGSGRTPGENGHVKFCNSGKSPLKKFWLVMYQGGPKQVLLLCEQANKAKNFDEKTFTGFYTFTDRVIEQAQKDIADLLGGRCPELRQFSDLQAIDKLAKKLRIEFEREQEALDVAIGKLKDAPAKYGKDSFVRDLNKSFDRLNELKNRLPALIVTHRDD